jgi:NACalpha-BTF3-like transcription factor
MKLVGPAIVAMMALSFVFTTVVVAAERIKEQQKGRTTQGSRASAGQQKLLETRRNLIEKKLATKDELKHLLETYQEKLASQSDQYEISKIMYDWDLLSQPKLEESKRELVNTRLDLDHVRHRLAEDDIALSLVQADAQENGLRTSLLERHGQTRILIRHNGTIDWSLAEAGKIGQFFLERFGRALPVSAMGQSTTHKRMGLDHRDAMDVALSPDSEEGRSLMAYLRNAGIPFIAFRHKLRGWATGAHIHIGRPSLRGERVKQSAPQQSSKHPDRG